MQFSVILAAIIPALVTAQGSSACGISGSYGCMVVANGTSIPMVCSAAGWVDLAPCLEGEVCATEDGDVTCKLAPKDGAKK